MQTIPPNNLTGGFNIETQTLSDFSGELIDYNLAVNKDIIKVTSNIFHISRQLLAQAYQQELSKVQTIPPGVPGLSIYHPAFQPSAFSVVDNLANGVSADVSSLLSKLEQHRELVSLEERTNFHIKEIKPLITSLRRSVIQLQIVVPSVTGTRYNDNLFDAFNKYTDWFLGWLEYIDKVTK